MMTRSRLRNRNRCFNEGGGPVLGALITEAGDFLVQEDGSFILV